MGDGSVRVWKGMIELEPVEFNQSLTPGKRRSKEAAEKHRISQAAMRELIERGELVVRQATPDDLAALDAARARKAAKPQLAGLGWA